MKILCLNLFCIISILLTNNLNAQKKVKIETTSLEIVDNKLVIKYDFVKSKKNQLFDVWLEITTASGKKLNASSLSGDLGNNVAAD